jgi:hypothetical protein
MRFGWCRAARGGGKPDGVPDVIVTLVYSMGIPCGVLRPDGHAMREIEHALQSAERSGDDHAFAFAGLALGFALVYRTTAAERDCGQELLAGPYFGLSGHQSA